MFLCDTGRLLAISIEACLTYDIGKVGKPGRQLLLVFGQAGPKVSSPADGFFVPYLTRVVGAKRAREMCMLCRRYKAPEALAMGLVHELAPVDALDAAVQRRNVVLGKDRNRRLRQDRPGVDAVIEAVGADAPIDLAMKIAARGARISIVGVTQNPAFPTHLQLAQFNELEIALGLCSVQRELPALLALTAAGRLQPAAVVTHHLPLSDGADAYARFHAREDGVGKVVLDPSR